MSSFKDLLARLSTISEAKVSPYATSHPSFGSITSKMRSGGLSSAPLDTIKFIREVLYLLDIINDEENNNLKRAAGFTGKKQAMLSILKAKQQIINSKTQEIADQVSSTLDDFINGVGVNRSREEKYAAQAAAQEIASQMRQSKSGKTMDDALTDIVSDDTILVKASVAKILFSIQKNLGEPGFDIDSEALMDVIDYSGKINSLETLKSFIKQISSEPGYEKIAAYLSSAVKPISAGTEDEEMEEDAEDVESLEMYDVGEEESDSVRGDIIEGEADTVWIGDDGEAVDGVVTYRANRNPRTGKIDIHLTGGYVTGNNPSARVDDDYIDFVISTSDYNEDYMADALADAEFQFFKMTSEDEESNYKPDYLDFDKDGNKDEPMKSALKDEDEELQVKQVKQYTIHYNSNEEVKRVDHSDRSAHVDVDLVNKYLKEGFPLSRACAAATSYPNDPNDGNEDSKMLGESYTNIYIIEQKRKDSYCTKKQEVSQSFKERYRPKTSYQLDDLRRYGM